MDEYSLPVVQAYMAHIQSNAELAVRDMLREIALRTKQRTGATRLHGMDFMDDGSQIVLNIDINEAEVSSEHREHRQK